jgi:hypothetical protein
MQGVNLLFSSAYNSSAYNMHSTRGRTSGSRVADYEFVWVEPEDGVRWEGLQQHNTAAPPATAAPANRTKVPTAAVPVSTVAQSNNLLMAFPLN